jgi:hypothetical protein
MFQFNIWRNAVVVTEEMGKAYVGLSDELKKDFLTIREACETMLVECSALEDGADKLTSRICHFKRIGIWNLDVVITIGSPIRILGLKRVLIDPSIDFPDYYPLFKIDISPAVRTSPAETILTERKATYITWDEFDFLQKKAKEYSNSASVLIAYLNSHFQSKINESVRPIPFYPELISRYRAMAESCGPSEETLHLLDMLNTLEHSPEQTLTKKHRWLGWIQGELIHLGATTVQAERDFTRDIFKGA